MTVITWIPLTRGYNNRINIYVSSPEKSPVDRQPPTHTLCMQIKLNWFGVRIIYRCLGMSSCPELIKWKWMCRRPRRNLLVKLFFHKIVLLSCLLIIITTTSITCERTSRGPVWVIEFHLFILPHSIFPTYNFNKRILYFLHNHPLSLDDSCLWQMMPS